jgi:hypothetical protein
MSELVDGLEDKRPSVGCTRITSKCACRASWRLFFCSSSYADSMIFLRKKAFQKRQREREQQKRDEARGDAETKTAAVEEVVAPAAATSA